MTAEAYGYFAQALSLDPNMEQARTMLAKTAPNNQQQPGVAEPRRVPSTENSHQPEYLQAQGPTPNELGTLAPVVSPRELAGINESNSNVAQPAPFNYQLAAKSFTRMADPFGATRPPVSQSVSSDVEENELNPSPISDHPNLPIDDPMQQILASTQQSAMSIDDVNVRPASFQTPDEEPAGPQTPPRTNVLRMPKLNPHVSGELVPPSPFGM
jgi:hypothetical protein